MTTNKMTYAEALTLTLTIEAVKENEVLAEKLQALLEQVSKKNSGKLSAKEQEKQQENESIKAEIVAVLERITVRQAIKELQAESETLSGYTNQKLSALIRQMVKDGVLERVELKRVAKFGLVGKEYQEQETGE